MRAANLLTGLYPPAVRQRWGADLGREVSESGILSWPDTLAGAARLWLHPGDWPETFTGQTRRVLTVALFAIIAATGLVLRTVAPSATLTADIGHPATSLWLAPLLTGIALAAPLPPLRREALRRLATVTVRTLAAPVAVALAVVAMAWSGATEHATGLADTAATISYWLTLGFIALRLCTLIARIAPNAALPTTRRLSAALLLIGAGLALAASQNLLTSVQTAPRPAPFVQTLTLGLLAAIALSVGQDLRQKKA